MTVLNASDPSASLAALVALIRRGESVVLIEGGTTVATVVPAVSGGTPAGPTPMPDGDDDEGEAWWRGTYEIQIPRRLVETIGQPVVVERRLPEINFSWLRSHDDDE